MECEFVEFQSDKTGVGVIAKVLRTTVDESCIKDGKVDVSSLDTIAYDPFTYGYYKVTERVGTAFKDGKNLN